MGQSNIMKYRMQKSNLEQTHRVAIINYRDQ